MEPDALAILEVLTTSMSTVTVLAFLYCAYQAFSKEGG